MKYAVGERELEFRRQLKELRDSSSLLGHTAALQARMAEDGYLFIRGLHQRETVLTARWSLRTAWEPMWPASPVTRTRSAPESAVPPIPTQARSNRGG